MALLATAGWLIFASTQEAEGHAVQLASVPAPNEQLAESPTSISIDFSEPLEPAVTTVQIWDTSPAELPIGEIEYTAEDALTVPVPDVLEPGIYTVIWRNLSTVDGHTWAGSFPFTVLEEDGGVPAGAVPPELQSLAEAPSANPSFLDTTARWIVLLGSAVMLGGVAYVLTVVLPSTRVIQSDSAAALRKLSMMILLLTTAIAAFLVLQGSLIQLLIQADDLGGLGNADELLTNTRLGKFLIARQALLLIMLVATFLAWRAKAGAALYAALSLLLLGSFGVLLTQSLVSHAAGADGAFWKISTDLLHFTAAALWVGAVIHIGLAMPRWLDELGATARTLFAAESFRRFSVLAAFSVLVLIISGVVSSLSQFSSFGQLFDTTYGWSLVGKMAVMLPLLFVAGLNAFIFQPRVSGAALEVSGGADDEPSGASSASQDLRRTLANTVRAEAVLGIMVLVAVGFLTQVEPARTVAEVEAAAAAQQAPTLSEKDEERGFFLEATQLGGLVISLEVKPAEVGQNTFEVGLGSEFGNVGDVSLVRLEFDHEDPEIGTSRLELDLLGSAKYQGEGTNLSLPGNWAVTTTVRRDGEDDVVTDFTVPVGVSLEGEDSSIWDWPFDGARSTGAIIALAVGGGLVVVVGGWQLVGWRRGR